MSLYQERGDGVGLARATVEREDAVTQGLAWHDWQSNAEAQAIR